MSSRALRHLLTPFQPFLANPETTEVVVNRPGEIGVESAGVWSWYRGSQPDVRPAGRSWDPGRVR